MKKEQLLRYCIWLLGVILGLEGAYISNIGGFIWVFCPFIGLSLAYTFETTYAKTNTSKVVMIVLMLVCNYPIAYLLQWVVLVFVALFRVIRAVFNFFT